MTLHGQDGRQVSLVVADRAPGFFGASVRADRGANRLHPLLCFSAETREKLCILKKVRYVCKK